MDRANSRIIVATDVAGKVVFCRKPKWIGSDHRKVVLSSPSAILSRAFKQGNVSRFCLTRSVTVYATDVVQGTSWSYSRDGPSTSVFFGSKSISFKERLCRAASDYRSVTITRDSDRQAVSLDSGRLASV